MQLSVEEYKAHPLFPFSDFRTNDASFLLLELFWTQVAREALGEELSQKIEPLMMCERDNGEEAFYNPIMLDFWIPDIRRGATIILRENFNNLPLLSDAKGDERFRAYYPLTFYPQKRGITGPDDEIEQVVYSSDLSDQAIKFVSNGLRAFLIDNISVQQVDQEIDTYFENLDNFPSQKELDDYEDRMYSDDD